MKAAEKEARRAWLGASDAAAILGLDRFRKPIDVWQEKTGRLEAVDDDERNKAASWGRWLERVLLERWEAETGLALTRSGRAPRQRTFVHREHPFIRATPDGYRLERGSATPLYVVEAKTSRNGKGFGDPGTDEIPRAYKVQAIVQAAVAGAPVVHVAALIAGQDFRRYVVEPTAAQREAVIAALVEFWTEYVLPDREPEELTEEYLRSKWPADNGEEMVATDADVALVERLRLGLTNKEQAEAAVQEVRTKIIERIGERSRLLGPGFAISYKRNRDGEKTDWKALAGDLERIVEGIAKAGTLEAEGPRGDRVSGRITDEMLELGLRSVTDGTLRSVHTAAVTGSRVFRPTFYEEEESR